MNKSEIPSAIISYSWDSEVHKTWVREIATRLRLNGVDVKLDQWHVKPGQSLTQFMEKEIVECDYVIIICTPDYYKKSLNRQGGVGYEQQIISGHIAAGVPREKFIPVVRRGEFESGLACAIPPHFSGIFAIDMRNEDIIDDSVELLLRNIFGELVHVVPEIGQKPNWKELEKEFKGLRLPTIDLDEYELLSGLAQHHRTPNTFYIPNESDRQVLNEGDFVKLMFNIKINEDPSDPENDGFFCERMWVMVTGRNGPYYTGVLSNVPMTSDEDGSLSIGDEVIFLLEHVIAIE